MMVPKSLRMEKWLETSIFERLPTRIGREFVAKKHGPHCTRKKYLIWRRSTKDQKQTDLVETP